MSGPRQRLIEANGIQLNIAEQGEGPPVLLCHGFPESWYSWRHQLAALAAAGFRAIAPDMRGYGKSTAPQETDQYTLFHLVGDMVGLLDALDLETAVIVGHDLGARVAWQAAQLKGLPVTVPALYLAGDHDFVLLLPGMDRLLAGLKVFVPALRDIRLIPGCGHWTQQERPDEVNTAIVDFLHGLPA
jgi:pimeloyl-ACP methyl ester carboxylesterase